MILEDWEKYSIFDDWRKLIPAKNSQTCDLEKLIPNFFKKKLPGKLVPLRYFLLQFTWYNRLILQYLKKGKNYSLLQFNLHSSYRRARDLQLWEYLTVFLVGNNASHLLSVNHSIKVIHHHHHYLITCLLHRRHT